MKKSNDNLTHNLNILTIHYIVGYFLQFNIIINTYYLKDLKCNFNSTFQPSFQRNRSYFLFKTIFAPIK